MSLPKPPALATWLLEHLAIGPNREAVIGDLAEQFTHRRSARWYWRQALAAIAVGLWRERYILWLAAAGTVIWRIVLEQYWWPIWRFKQTSALNYVPWLPWPAMDFALQSVLNVLPVLVVLAAYLAATRNLTFPMLRRGVLVGVLTLPVSFIPALSVLSTAWRTLAPTREMAIQNPMLLPMLRVLAQAMYAIPLFLALALSMWAARTCQPSSGALPSMEGEVT